MPGYFQADDSIFYPESVITEQLSSTANVTEHPVEQGVAVSDHAQKLPETASLIIRVSETPFDPGASFIVDIRDEAPGDPVPDGVIQLPQTRFTVRNVPFAQRPVAALNWLRQRRGERVSYFSTKFPEFTDWVITSVSVTRKNRLSLEIALQLKEVRVGLSEEVSIPPRKVRPKKAVKKVDKGNQSGKPIPADKRAASLLEGVLGLAGLSAQEDTPQQNPEAGARTLPSSQ